MSGNNAQLIVALEGNVIQTVALAAPVLSIGRTPDNALPLPHPMVSRHHAEIRLTAEGAVITDLGSSNGTLVDGSALLPNQPRQLVNGTVVAIGPFVLTYQASGSVPAADAVPDVAPEPVAPPPTPVSAAVVPPPVTAKPPIKAFRLPLLDGYGSRYLRDLPVIYHDAEFLGRFLLIFENIWEPLEQRVDAIDGYFDPHTCPTGFLPWIASWLDLPLNPHWPESRVRQLVAEAMELYRWRGTAYGLGRMIEVRTGMTAMVSEVQGQPHVFKVRIVSEPGAAVDRALLEEVINAHKPAHAGYVLELGE